MSARQPTFVSPHRMLPSVDRLYSRLPITLQNLACSLYGLREARARYSPDFTRRLESLLASEWLGAEEIQAYQEEQLQRTIKHAFETVPFYRDRLLALRLRPEDIRTRADLEKLPILTKADVRAHAPEMLSSAASKREIVAAHTSGTTGTSLHFYLNRSSTPERWALWWRHRMRFGVKPGAWHANFTGKLAVPPAQTAPPFWRWNLPMHQIVVNMHHLTPAKIEPLVALLDKHPVTYFSGYPSVVHAFVQCLLERDLRLAHPPGYVFTGAENMLEYQRQDIHRATGAVITDQYGFSEGCGNASQCPELVYHEDFEYGILECHEPSIAPDGTRSGRVLATGFANPAFPFIRYDIGDWATWAPPQHRCACGRRSAVILDVEGRADDYVITPEGRRIMRFDYIFKDTANIRESQVVQRRLGGITVRIVREPAYGEADEALVRGLVRQWISAALEVEFEYVPEIPRTARGKFQAVKSELNRPSV
jgi:phenylacetate-CoA ligase